MAALRDVRLEDFGGGPGDHDNTPALNAVHSLAREERGIKLRLGVGTYRFGSKPDDFTACLKIVGEDKFRSRLMRCYVELTPAAFLTWREIAGASTDPETGNTIRGSELRDCQVTCAGDSHGGHLVEMTTDGPVTGFTRICGVKLSHNKLGGSYLRPLRIDGRKNLTAGGQGFRDVFMEDTFLFPAPGYPISAIFLNCTNLNASFWAGGDVVVTGGGNGLGASTYGRLWIEALGTLTYDYACRYSSYGNVGAIVRTPNVVSCQHHGLGA